MRPGPRRLVPRERHELGVRLRVRLLPPGYRAQVHVAVERNAGDAHGRDDGHRGVAELERPARVRIERVPQLRGDAMGDHGVYGGVCDLPFREVVGAPVRDLLGLRQVDVEQVGRELRQPRPAALGAVHQARHQERAPRLAQPYALRLEECVLERGVVREQGHTLERPEQRDRHVPEIEHVDRRGIRIVDLRQPRRRPDRIEPGVALLFRLVHRQAPGLGDLGPRRTTIAFARRRLDVEPERAPAAQRRQHLAGAAGVGDHLDVDVEQIEQVDLRRRRLDAPADVRQVAAQAAAIVGMQGIDAGDLEGGARQPEPHARGGRRGQ